MTEIITYRLSATGVWQYEFCLDGEKFGSVVSVVSPREPVRIEGPDIHWYSRFDIDLEIVPGISRRVKDNATGEEIYRKFREKGILIRHFTVERIRDYNRISIGTEEQMTVVISAAAEIVDSD